MDVRIPPAVPSTAGQQEEHEHMSRGALHTDDISARGRRDGADHLSFGLRPVCLCLDSCLTVVSALEHLSG